MKVVALVSGGKDSCYAMMRCIQYGHEIVALANLIPADDATDELDSYMYQTVGHQIVVSYAKCMGLPLFRRRIQGSTRHYGLSYSMTSGDEVEDMFILLNEVKKQIPCVGAVSSGAIASDYQRLRIESVCSRLGLISLAYLWKQDQSFLLQEMIRNGITAITVKVAAIGLNPSKHLGKDMVYLESHLHKLKELYGINVCGEGGEYETLTLDCPLFKNARIVLDEFQTVLHSSDAIAPVGILHPVAFHLEKKMEESISSNGIDEGISQDNIDSVIEVQGVDAQQKGEAVIEFVAVSSKQRDEELKVSRTIKDNIFSISCWLQDSGKTSADLREDMEAVLMRIEALLMENGSSWENVVYIHLYIANMDEFAVANETYVRYITEDKCRFGVPSRSTIELPLVLVGLGRAYIEVLVANDSSTKKILHVQSISCWAPSCIGPYSQATLHNDILYMAGQLGLDPATMGLCEGPVAQLERALENSEAVAGCFNCSIYTSAVAFVIYCSASMGETERIALQNKTEMLLKSHHSEKSKVLDPILLYVIVPDLPKRALVEVKPLLYTGEYLLAPSDHAMEYQSTGQGYWGFEYATWHDICLQKCVAYGKICTAILSVSEELAAKICSLGDVKSKHLVREEQVNMIARFCIYRLDRVLMENHFSWDDVMNFRLCFASNRLNFPHRTLSQIFSNVFDEFGQMSGRIKVNAEPIIHVVPVLGAGRSLSSMDDIFTCEFIASKC